MTAYAPESIGEIDITLLTVGKIYCHNIYIGILLYYTNRIYRLIINHNNCSYKQVMSDKQNL